MNLKLRYLKYISRKIEALPLTERITFERLVDLILPFRPFVDWLSLRKLRKLSLESQNQMDTNSGWAKLEFDEKK